jgi:hypothetical protein
MYILWTIFCICAKIKFDLISIKVIGHIFFITTFTKLQYLAFNLQQSSISINNPQLFWEHWMMIRVGWGIGGLNWG